MFGLNDKKMILTSAILLIIFSALVLSLLFIKSKINEPFTVNSRLNLKTDLSNKIDGMHEYNCKKPLDSLGPYMNRCPLHNNMSNNNRINLKNVGPLKNFHQCFNGSVTLPELKRRVKYDNKKEILGVNKLGMIQTINPIDNVYKNVNY